MNEQKIVISDIDIPFSRLVLIILKVMLATLPAVFLFWAILLLLALFLLPLPPVSW